MGRNGGGSPRNGARCRTPGHAEALPGRLAQALRACGDEQAILLLFGPEAGVTACGKPSARLRWFRRGRLKDGECLLPRLVTSDRPVLLNDRQVKIPGLMDGAVRSVLSTPLLADGRVWGVLVCADGEMAPPARARRLKRIEEAARGLGAWAKRTAEMQPADAASPYARALREITALAGADAEGNQVLEMAAKQVAQALGGVALIAEGETVVACSGRFPRVGEPAPAALTPWIERALRAGRLVCVDRQGQPDPQGAEWPRSISRRAYAGAPLGEDDEARFGLHVFTSRPCDEHGARFLALAAEALKTWLARRRGEQQRLRAVAELGIVCQLGQTLGGGLAIERLLAAAMSNVAEAMNADTCSLVVADRESGELIVDTAFGLSEGIIRGERARLGQGIASYVIQQGEPVVIGDPRTDPRLEGIDFRPRPEIHSAICVPIKLAGAVDAVLSVSRRHDPRPFSDDDLKLACDLADQLIPCVENARLYQETAERLKALSTLPDVAEAVSSSLNVVEILRPLAERIVALSGAPRGRTYRLTGSSRLEPIWFVGHPQPAPGDTLPADRGAAGRAIKEGKPVLVVAGRRSPTTAAERRHAASDCFLAIPVKVRDRFVGVVCLDCDPGDAGRVLGFDVALLERLVASAAIAVLNAVAHDQLRNNLAELTTLHQSAQRINASVTPHALLAALEQAARQVMGAKWVRFALFDVPPDSDILSHCADLLLGLDPESRAGQAARRVSKPVTGSLGRLRNSALVEALPRSDPGTQLALLPLAHQQGTLGIGVAGGLSGAPTPKQTALLSAIFSHGAAALKHALDHEQMLRRQSLELSALYDLSEAVSSATSPQAALESVLDFARSLIPYDRAAVLTWSDEHSSLQLEAGRGFDIGPASRERRALERDGVMAWVAREGKAFLSADAGGGGFGSGLRSAMALPLLMGNRCIGVLAFQSASRQAYTEAQVKVLSVVAAQAAAIYEALRSLGQLSRYTENILRSIVAGVIGLDHAGRIVMWSPMAEAILRHPAEEAVGRLFDSVVDEISRRERAPALTALSLVVRKVMQSGAASTGHELSLPNGGSRSRSLSVSCSPLRSGEEEPPGAVMLVEDVTERRELEERMLRVNQLATIGHLAANVAHEVRNPLSAIKTAAQFLATEYADEQVVGQFAGIINSECDRLTKVTTDFLVFARPPSPRFEPVRIEDIIERSLQLMGPESEQREIRVVCEYARPLPTVLADAQELQQVFLNLLTNALQAIDEQGEIRVRARCVGGPGAEAMEVALSDTGRGIPPHYLNDIFTPFFTTKTKGTGLGLAIVRKIVEAHGGTVSAESAPQQGATLTVRLPLVALPAAPLPADLDRPVIADPEVRAQLPLFREG